MKYGKKGCNHSWVYNNSIDGRARRKCTKEDCQATQVSGCYDEDKDKWFDSHFFVVNTWPNKNDLVWSKEEIKLPV